MQQDKPAGHARPKRRPCTHRSYRMTCEEYDELRMRAAGRCEMCGVAEEETPHRVLFIDHDPAVGQDAVRGLLCNRCNSGLDQPALAGAARDWYLSTPWYLDSPARARRRRMEEERKAVRSELLAALDAATAEYRETAARLKAARARRRAARLALGRSAR